MFGVDLVFAEYGLLISVFCHAIQDLLHYFFGSWMLRVEGEIDKLDHLGVGLRQLHHEVLGLDSPDPDWPCSEFRHLPLSIAFVNYGLDVVD